MSNAKLSIRNKKRLKSDDKQLTCTCDVSFIPQYETIPTQIEWLTLLSIYSYTCWCCFIFKSLFSSTFTDLLSPILAILSVYEWSFFVLSIKFYTIYLKGVLMNDLCLRLSKQLLKYSHSIPTWWLTFFLWQIYISTWILGLLLISSPHLCLSLIEV